ncbi:Redoxin [Limtongia smithiae]|uniref:Redoxin n=1 Tax=Limtongia smithiae TaxID=1125753 RepID=UPI0034CE9F82
MVSVGDKFPAGAEFVYVPYTPESADIKACGIPIGLNFDKEFAGKTVVIVSIPGSFTPTCTVNHIPPYIANLPTLKAKGVDALVVLSANDPFVQSAFGKANGAADESVYFVCDPAASVSKSLGEGFTVDMPPAFGTRTARYALVVKDGVVTYVAAEASPKDLVGSSYEAVEAAL